MHRRRPGHCDDRGKRAAVSRKQITKDTKEHKGFSESSGGAREPHGLERVDLAVMRRIIWKALAAGVFISVLILCLELFVPAHSPRSVALPGWIAIIFFWGFDGGRGPWPWIVFNVANAIVYSMLALGVLLLWKLFSRRRQKFDQPV
jgi:hypothetical protein